MPTTRGPFAIEWLATQQRFEGRPEETVLAAALRAGLAVRSSCRNGSCRACIVRLASGHVHYRIEWPGLSAEEKRDGFILPCVAYPESDLRISPA